MIDTNALSQNSGCHALIEATIDNLHLTDDQPLVLAILALAQAIKEQK